MKNFEKILYMWKNFCRECKINNFAEILYFGKILELKMWHKELGENFILGENNVSVEKWIIINIEEKKSGSPSKWETPTATSNTQKWWTRRWWSATHLGVCSYWSVVARSFYYIFYTTKFQSNTIYAAHHSVRQHSIENGLLSFWMDFTFVILCMSMRMKWIWREFGQLWPGSCCLLRDICTKGTLSSSVYLKWSNTKSRVCEAASARLVCTTRVYCTPSTRIGILKQQTHFR